MWLFLSLVSNSVQAQSLTTRLDQLLARQILGNGPGVSIGVIHKGNIVYAGTAGRAQVNTREKISLRTRFRMASVSKQFTAMGVLLLEEEGKLKLTDPLSQFFPEFRTELSLHITLQHLLTHTSGIRDYEELMDSTWHRQILDEDVVKLLQDQTQTYFKAGTQFRYSNSGFCLLAMVVQRVSGQAYGKFMKERLFLPLGLKETFVYEAGKAYPHRALGYTVTDEGNTQESDQSLTSATRGDGCVYTSLADYFRWHQALQQGKPLDLIKKLQTIAFTFPELPDSGYGLGWFIRRTSPIELFHSGTTSGFSNVVIRIPEKDVLLIMFSNRANHHAFFNEVLTVLQTEPDLKPQMNWEIFHRLTN